MPCGLQRPWTAAENSKVKRRVIAASAIERYVDTCIHAASCSYDVIRRPFAASFCDLAVAPWILLLFEKAASGRSQLQSILTLPASISVGTEGFEQAQIETEQTRPREKEVYQTVAGEAIPHSEADFRWCPTAFNHVRSG